MTPALTAALARLHALAFHTEADYEAYLRVAQEIADLEQYWDKTPRRLMERVLASQEEMIAVHAAVLLALDLRPYAQHLVGCAQTPCSCGLARLLDEPG